MARKHKIDELVRKLYHCSDADLIQEFEQAQADIAAGRCQVPETAPGDFDRLWAKLVEQEEQREKARKNICLLYTSRCV